jgi:hypothetical protein
MSLNVDVAGFEYKENTHASLPLEIQTHVPDALFENHQDALALCVLPFFLLSRSFSHQLLMTETSKRSIKRLRSKG